MLRIEYQKNTWKDVLSAQLNWEEVGGSENERKERCLQQP
jgi:hypothetical protein